MNEVSIQVPELSDEQRFWLRLEMERLDDTWKYGSEFRRIRPMQEFKVVVNKGFDPKDLEKRDQIMFHAGRYASGAKDQNAFRAHLAMQRLLAAESDPT